MLEDRAAELVKLETTEWRLRKKCLQEARKQEAKALRKLLKLESQCQEAHESHRNVAAQLQEALAVKAAVEAARTQMTIQKEQLLVDLAAQQQANTLLNTQLADRQQAITLLETQVADRQQAITLLNTQLAEANTGKHQAQEATAAAQQAAQAAASAAETTQQQLRAQLHQQRAEHSRLLAQIQEVNSELTTLQGQLVEVNSQVFTLRGELEYQTAQHTRFAAREREQQQELELERQRRRQLAQKLQEAEAGRVKAEEATAAAKQAAQAAASAAEASEEQLRAQLQQQRTQHNSLQEQLSTEVLTLRGQLEVQSTQQQKTLASLKEQHQQQLQEQEALLQQQAAELQALRNKINKAEESARAQQDTKRCVSDDTADVNGPDRTAGCTSRQVEAQAAFNVKQAEAKAAASKAMQALRGASSAASRAPSHKEEEPKVAALEAAHEARPFERKAKTIKGQAGPGRLFVSALAASTGSAADATVRISRAPTAKKAVDDSRIKAEEELAAAQQAAQEAAGKAEAAQQQLRAHMAETRQLMAVALQSMDTVHWQQGLLLQLEEVIKEERGIHQQQAAKIQQQATELQVAQDQLQSRETRVRELLAIIELVATEDEQPAAPAMVADGWGPAPKELVFSVTAEVVSGGDFPTLSSSDSRRLTCHGLKELLPCDAHPHNGIPPVHVPDAAWGEVVEVALKRQVVNGVSVLTSRLLQRWEAGTDARSDPLVTSFEDAQRVLAAALDRW